MTIKDEIITELEQMPESSLSQVLAFVHSLKQKPDQHPVVEDELWQAYLDSEQEREEVYRRLANS